ncbi:hypothetical protein GCM10009104_15700 [Marinobacterium maritimum]|uniref:Uncharacterized protein n=1 Tax=Marinobacterium maritimum TaxID=500162 RepID=A0ABP3T840_9GAMM
MVNSIPKEIWIAAVSAILGALASFYIPSLLKADNIELEFAPFYKEKFINIPNLLDGRVEISVDGKPQQNLSVMDVYLFNRSYKDIKKIPLTFEFYSDGNSPLPELLGKQLKVPETFPKDSVSEVVQTDRSHVRYEVSSMPVADDYDTDFIASFVFLGETSPKVRVQSDYTDNKVISIYEYDKARRERNEIIQIFSIFIPLLALFIAWLIWDTRRSSAKFLDKLGDAAEEIGEFSIGKEKLREIAIESYKRATKKTKKRVN